MAGVIKNPDGSVQFPSVIPPEVEWPIGINPAAGSVPLGVVQQSTSSAPLGSSVKDSSASSRPSLPPSSRSEARRPVVPMVSLLKRVETTLPQSKSALEGENSSTSSSDTDDEPVSVRHGLFRKVTNAENPPKRAFNRFSVANDMFRTKGKVSRKDGRLSISVNERGNSGYLAKALGANFLGHHEIRPSHEKSESPIKKQYDSNIRQAVRQSCNITHSTPFTSSPTRSPPPLKIVIMVLGSRGDIQPFLRLGKILKEEHGHKVRIATHPAFREFVENDSKLEFFSVGGDPSELMAFMVKNPGMLLLDVEVNSISNVVGMIPKMETIRAGEIGRRRAQMAEMFQGFWRACINSTDDEENPRNRKMMGLNNPFIADAIIANPPCFAHVHCAERLGVPLHLMFTFPYTPTQFFPHPLANIKKTNVDPGYTNFMSYPLVEMMTWQG
jgi:hypothetical protein